MGKLYMCECCANFKYVDELMYIIPEDEIAICKLCVLTGNADFDLTNEQKNNLDILNHGAVRDEARPN